MNGIALAVGVLHVFIFYMESLAWGQPRTNRAFGIRSQADAETTRPFAFNQGFYNLFLALGIFVGFFLVSREHTAEGRALLHFCMASIFGAGVVLYFSTKMLRPALMQAGPALVYFLILFFS